MAGSPRQAPGGRFFYGWWLLGAGTAILMLQGGLFTYGFTAFFVPLAAELGASRGALSLAFSFTRLESGLLGPIEGFFIDRFGPRRVLLLGFVVFGVAYVVFSRVDSLLGFYLVFPFLALGASLSGFLPVVTAVNNWFSRRRGFATGISSAGVNLGGVLVAVVAVAIGALGWRTAAVGIGLLALALGLPLATMVRHKPQPYGYLPDGDAPGEAHPYPGAAGSPGVARHGAVPDPEFTPVQALRTSAFWLVAMSHSFSLLIVGAVTIHEIPVLVDAGISYETAAGVLAFMTAVAMVGRISGGFIGDRVGKKPTLIVCFAMMSVGLLVLATASTVPQALVFAVLYGLGYGARAPLLVALRGDYFGPRNFATIMGLSQPIMMIGSFVGPIAAGFAFDVQGSYRMVFTVIALVNLVGALLVLFFTKPSLPQARAAATGGPVAR